MSFLFDKFQLMITTVWWYWVGLVSIYSFTVWFFTELFFLVYHKLFLFLTLLITLKFELNIIFIFFPTVTFSSFHIVNWFPLPFILFWIVEFLTEQKFSSSFLHTILSLLLNIRLHLSSTSITLWNLCFFTTRFLLRF